MGGLGPNKEHWAFLCEGHAKDTRIPERFAGEGIATSDWRVKWRFRIGRYSADPFTRSRVFKLILTLRARDATSRRDVDRINFEAPRRRNWRSIRNSRRDERAHERALAVFRE